jgi:hypothetical protein
MVLRYLPSKYTILYGKMSYVEMAPYVELVGIAR